MHSEKKRPTPSKNNRSAYETMSTSPKSFFIRFKIESYAAVDNTIEIAKDAVECALIIA
jgi:hypothetical protein